MHDILLAIPLGILLCFMIGPVFFIVLETAAVKGFRAAIVFDLGVVTADFTFITIAYFSSYKLITNIQNEAGLFIFGGLIMVTYGIISFIKIKKINKNTDLEDNLDTEILKTNYRNLFLKGFLLNFINVGVLGFWLLIFITFGPQLQLKPFRLIVFFSSVIGTYLVVDIIKIVLAKKLKNKMTPNNIVIIKKVTSILLIVFGATIMLQGFFPSDQKMVKSALKKIELKTNPQR